MLNGLDLTNNYNNKNNICLNIPIRPKNYYKNMFLRPYYYKNPHKRFKIDKTILSRIQFSKRKFPIITYNIYNFV